MQETRKRIQLALVLAAFLAFVIWDTRRGNKMVAAIEAHGTNAHAVVVNTHYAKGQTLDVEFLYKGQRRYVAGVRTSNFQAKPGDSVSLLFLPNRPDYGILLEDRFFTVPRKSYFGWIDGHQN